MKNVTSNTFFLVTAILSVIFLYLLTSIVQLRTQRAYGNQSNVKGVSTAQAQEEQPPESIDYTIPNQADAMSVPDFFRDLLKGIPDDTEIETKGSAGSGGGTGGGGTGGGGGGGPVVIDDPAFVARAGAARSNGYHQMPEPVGDEYFLRDPPDCRYGNIELLKLINQASIMWKNKYPDSRVELWNINASGGHASHRNGVDVDIAITNESAANMCSAFYDQAGSCGGGLSEGQCRSIELGKMFLSSNIVSMIFYDDPAVNEAIMAYARANNKTNLVLIEPWGTQACGAGHHNHFHVRILDSYRLETFEPAGC